MISYLFGCNFDFKVQRTTYSISGSTTLYFRKYNARVPRCTCTSVPRKYTQNGASCTGCYRRLTGAGTLFLFEIFAETPETSRVHRAQYHRRKRKIPYSPCARRGRRQLRRIDRRNCHKTTSGASCTHRIARFVRAVWCVKEPTARANFFPRVTGTGWCARRGARDVPRRKKTTARRGGKDSTFLLKT